MISVSEAIKIVHSNSVTLDVEIVAVRSSFGQVLSADVISPLDLPPFHQSAMDGYALHLSDVQSKNQLRIIGESAAGSVFHGTINAGECVRIFTGARLPEGADCIVVKENSTEEGELLCINENSTEHWQNIRSCGSQVKKGEVAIHSGTLINAATAGYLSALGIVNAQVYRKPRVTIIVTGSELVAPGETLGEGQIYESNSAMLEAALRSVHIPSCNVLYLKDDKTIIAETVRQSIKDNDLILLTGGISVGKYDFVGEILREEGVDEHFYKIAQKPGKPLFFGSIGNTVIFGLPGNPAAALCCFYEYVYPGILKMIGHTSRIGLSRQKMILGEAWKKKAGLANFLKGKISNGKVFPLDAQESFMLSSFATADCLIFIPAEIDVAHAGDEVEVHLLPTS